MNRRLNNLLSIKSLVTLTMTAVFAVLAALGRISPQEFLTAYTVVIGFYFGTQSQKSGGSTE